MTGNTVPVSLRGALKSWSIRTVIGWSWMAAFPLIAAGTLFWRWFWAYLGLVAVGQVALTLLLVRFSPSLLIERVQRRKDVEAWDRPLVIWAVVILPLVCLITAGLDHRWGWSVIPAWLRWVSLFLAAAGHAVTDWSMLSNVYFSPLVRIQAERGHRVADTGPYRIVRHPGYLGAMVLQLATPLILGSWWALLPATAACAVMVVRTAKEDATLRAKLDGYTQYTQHTRWRLFPGVW